MRYKAANTGEKRDRMPLLHRVAYRLSIVHCYHIFYILKNVMTSSLVLVLTLQACEEVSQILPRNCGDGTLSLQQLFIQLGSQSPSAVYGRSVLCSKMPLRNIAL